MVKSSQLSLELITSSARDRSLDMAKFKGCMGHGPYLADINDGVAVAKTLEISGTPSFVVGKVSGDYLEGYLVVGAQPFSAFDAVVKKSFPRNDVCRLKVGMRSSEF